MKKNFLFFTLLCICASSILAQNLDIQGKVTSSDDPEGVPGVTIIIKDNPQIGTITDVFGDYSIECKAGDVLVFRFVGYTTKEVPVIVSGTVNVVLEPENIQIQELVVTALGMKRDKKALGYSVQEVAGEELSKTKELNVINSLSGKVAGVNITQGGGGLDGGGARIVIRGETSMAGNNNPLYVIDGVPGGPNDVASDDIESLNVLKGPAAAALYGSRAAAGVIVITTKKGTKKKGIGVEINANNSFQTPFVLPEYQNEFGQGTGGQYKYFDGNNGVWPDGTISNDDYSINWGPRFDGELRPQFTGLDPWVAYSDNVRDFYQTGFILNNNVAISGGNEKSNVRLSYTNISQRGIIPNTGIAKNRIDLSAGTQMTEKLSVSANIKYTNGQSDNTRGADVRLYPRNIDINALKDYWVPGLEGLQQRKWRNSSNNPYFVVYENTNSYYNTRFIANTNLNYDITSYLSLMGRIGINEYNNENKGRTAFSTVGSNNQYGSFNASQGRGYELNSDFLLTFQKDISSRFNLKASMGGNMMRRENSGLNGSVAQLFIPEIYNLGNHRKYPRTGNYYNQKRLNSLYTFANLAYDEKIYFDVTARNDWSSTLPGDNNSYFYPSFTLSGLMDKVLELPRWVSFWKLRGNWATVGNDTDPYQLQDAYFWGWGEGGKSIINQSNVKANASLKPELTTAWEAGTDIRLFNYRVNIDVTYYNSVTYNQLLRVEVSPTTGYEFFMKNAGRIRNTGVELMLTTENIKTKDFTWTTNLNYARDRAVVEEYDPENPEAFLSRSITKHLFVEDKIGDRRGAIYGKGYKRAPNGEILFTKSGDSQRGEKQYLGNYNPDWIGSITNRLRYKNMELSFLLDLRYGGVFYSQTNYNLNIRGLSEATLLGGKDENGNIVPREFIVPDGMIEENGTYRKLTSDDLRASGLSSGGLSGQTYWENMMDEEIPEAVIFDATYLKFRELSITYNIPAKKLKDKFIHSLSFGMVVRNLAVWSKVPNVDPETFGSSGAGQIPGYDAGGIPSVRNIALNINLKF